VRRDAWPTADNTASGALVENYMRFEGNRDELAFSIPIPGGGPFTWYAIAVGYDSGGNAGPRLCDVVDGTYNAPVREALTPSVRHTDGKTQRQIEVKEKLQAFIDWLTSNAQVGYIGEVGWPWDGVLAWNDVATAWFGLANQNNLWETAWAVGEMWGSSYQLQPYLFQNGTYTPKGQATVLEANESNGVYKRGVNAAGAEFGAPSTDTNTSFSNLNRGTAGTNYLWNGAATYQYMYGRGHRLVRIPFRWERIQPTLGQALDAAELQRMRDSVNAAQAAGLEIILDVHNYGAYWLGQGGVGVRYTIGTAQVTFDHFADLWSRLASEFNAYSGVIGYGLMNEPVNMTGINGMTPAQTWEAAAQRAADAIRGAVLPTGQSPRWILVGGYQWSGTWSPGVNHRGPFVTDAQNKVRYEAHQYFDFDSSGRYSPNELNAVLEENWIRWEPNVEMWDIANDLGEGKEVYSIEVYRAGNPAPLDVCALWKRSVVDAPITACQEGGGGCTHHTYEYRIVVTDLRDGSQRDYATSLSGFYQ
jgi:aryl-phospho-beta-D-glucosidase BglC (GH1 family)